MSEQRWSKVGWENVGNVRAKSEQVDWENVGAELEQGGKENGIWQKYVASCLIIVGLFPSNHFVCYGFYVTSILNVLSVLDRWNTLTSILTREETGTLSFHDQDDEVKQYINGRYFSASEAAWQIFQFNLHGKYLITGYSVAAAWSWCFAIFVNKFCKIMKVFEKLDHLKSWWVLCQH